MLVAASVCPSPPLLVEAVRPQAPDWLVELRSVTLDSVRRLAASDVDTIVAIGAGDATRVHDSDAGGSLSRFGVPVHVGGRRQVLPLSLTIAAYLLDATGWHEARRYAEIAADEEPSIRARIGTDAASDATRVALLVIGDGSARRTTTAPGPYEPSAASFDAAARRALERPDPERLLRIDDDLARDLWVGGLAAWQALAGAMRASIAAGNTVAATVRYDAAPVGVWYAVVDYAIKGADR